MINKPIISLVLIISFTYSYTKPIDKKSETPRPFLFEKTENPNYFKLSIPQSVQKHPIKSAIGGGAAAYGLKLIFEGAKARNIKPDNHGAYNYNMIGFGTEVIGTILTATGIAILYTVFSEKNETEEKNNSSN